MNSATMSRTWRDCKSGHQRMELLKALSEKDERTHPDLTTYLDDCKKLILSSAVRVGENVNNVTIGPCRGDESFGLVNERQKSSVSSKTDQQVPLVKKPARTRRKNEEVCSSLFPGKDAVTVSKLLTELEHQRRNEVQDIMRVRMEKVLADREQAEKEAAQFKATLEKESAAKALQAEEEMRELKEEELLRAAQREQQLKIEQQLQAEKVSKRAEQIREAEQRQKEVIQLRKMIDEIQKYHQEYSQNYRCIHSLIMSCQDKQALKPVLEGQNFYFESWPILLQCCKENKICSEDVKTAKDSVSFIKALHTTVKEEIDKIHQRLAQKSEDHNRKAQMLPVLEEVADSKAPQPEILPPSIKPTTPDVHSESYDFIDKASLTIYETLKNFKLSNEKLFEQLLKDNSLKKFRSDCQKAVNVPVNAISHSSASHLHDKLKKLSGLLSGQSVVISEGVRVSASVHPAGVPFCKDLLAKKFVRQGALTVSSKPEAAFPIASVMVALWQEHADWGQLVLAHFHEECPYLVPAFWPQLEGQSDKDYYKSLGYIYNEDGEVEKQDKFLKRMSGIMRLYSALLISRPPRDRQNRPHPHDLSQGWRWLASLLNLEPRPGICATVIYDFLEVVGNSMFLHYGRQFQKLLILICKEYYPRLKKVSECSSGPVVRLEMLLEQILKRGGSIEPPQGMLPPNFW